MNGQANLDQGQSFRWELGPGGAAGSAALESIHTGKAYVFSLVFDVPNPFGVAFTYRRSVDASDTAYGTRTCSSCPGTSVTVSDPTLDGAAPGRGRATFSVAETGHVWDAFHQTQYFVHCHQQVPSEAEPFSKDQCKNDGWENFGQPAFMNQEDCVSYVATHGRNPPNG